MKTQNLQEARYQRLNPLDAIVMFETNERL